VDSFEIVKYVHMVHDESFFNLHKLGHSDCYFFLALFCFFSTNVFICIWYLMWKLLSVQWDWRIGLCCVCD